MRRSWLVLAALLLILSTVISPYRSFAEGLSLANDTTNEKLELSSIDATRDTVENATHYVDNEFLENIQLFTSTESGELVDGQTINRWETLGVRYDWTSPNKTIKKGDTLRVKLPEGLEFKVNNEIPIYHEDNLVGTAVVSTHTDDIVITFTTDYAENHDDVTIFIEAGITLNAVTYNMTGPVTVKFPSKGGDYEFDFDIVGSGTGRDEQLNKYSWKYDGLKNEISWTVRINFAEDNMDNVVLIDKLEPGHEIIEESFEIFTTEFRFPSETALNPVEVPGSRYYFTAAEKERMLTLDDDKMGYTLTLGDIDQTYVIDYKTKYTGMNIVDREPVKNLATLTYDGEEIEYDAIYEYNWIKGGATG